MHYARNIDCRKAPAAVEEALLLPSSNEKITDDLTAHVVDAESESAKLCCPRSVDRGAEVPAGVAEEAMCPSIVREIADDLTCAVGAATLGAAGARIID